MDIQTQYINLHQLLTDRQFIVPQYQRTYSWKTRQRRDLFNDIERSYLAEGSVDHFMSTVVVLYKGAQNTDESHCGCHEVDIVDGQQRITTLIMLLKAISKSLDESDPAQEALRANIERLLVKEHDANSLILETNHDASGHLGKYLRTGNYLNFRTANTMEDRQLLSSMRECESFVEEWSENEFPLEDLVSHLFKRLKFVFHQITDERVVYTVFEAQNSRGLDVSWIDRLKSMLMAIVFESTEGKSSNELIDEVHRIWSEIYRTIGSRVEELSPDILRFAATLKGRPYPNEPIGEEAEAAEQLYEVVRGSPDDVIRVSKFMLAVTRVVCALDRESEVRRLDAITRPSQAKLLAIAIRIRRNIDKELILRRWESVTFRIYGMGRRGRRTARLEYTRLAWHIVNETRLYPTERIMNELQRIGDRFCSIESAVSELRQTNCYENLRGESLIYFFRKYEEHLANLKGQKLDKKFWRGRLGSQEYTDSVEHILPQSSGKGEHVHWLGNLMLLPPRLNMSLSADSPKEKAESYRKTGLRTAIEVAEQVSRSWTKRDVARRDRELLKWAIQEWAD